MEGSPDGFLLSDFGCSLTDGVFHIGSCLVSQPPGGILPGHHKDCHRAYRSAQPLVIANE